MRRKENRGSNAEFLTADTLLSSENAGVDTQEETNPFKSGGALSFFCCLFTATNTFSENGKVHNLPVDKGETKASFSLFNSLELSRGFNS